MPQAATACTTLEDVECTHCGVEMSSHVGSSGTIRYFHCPSCSRWTTSMYSEVLRADTKMRARKISAAAAPSPERAGPASVKERLESWLQSLAGNDPYRTLGVIPSISDAGLRDRYLALARTHHPDRGGSADEMRKINEAYEQVLAHREQNRASMRPTGIPLASR